MIVASKRPQKRILIVPDYFTPYDSAKQLCSHLTEMGYDAKVFSHLESLYMSQRELERRCRIKRLDLLVTLQTGCLLAGRVTECPRVFVNPDWTVGDRMEEQLSENCHVNRDEIEMAQEMADPAFIERGNKPAYGWLSLSEVGIEGAEEHLKRFNTATYIRDFELSSTLGMNVLTQQINNLLED